ncbi:hypothetical protein [Haliea sp.]
MIESRIAASADAPAVERTAFGPGRPVFFAVHGLRTMRPLAGVHLAVCLLFSGVLMLGFSAPALAQTVPMACMGAEHRAFDFWIGDWNVHRADGQLAGTNSITREIGGCVLHERYDTGRGYSGESFNIYDASRQTWHQTWVDSSGLLLLLEGGVRDGRMVLEGETTGTNQAITRHRISWTPAADGSVRQLWESTDASGAWVVAFDGRYTRR